MFVSGYKREQVCDAPLIPLDYKVSLRRAR